VDTFAGAFVDQGSGEAGARSAVGECLLGRPEDQRGARTARGQGEQVAQGAAVVQLGAVPGSGEELADLYPACPLARPRQRTRAGEVARHIVVAERRHQGRSSSYGDGILAEDVPDEGGLPGGVEVVRPACAAPVTVEIPSCMNGPTVETTTSVGSRSRVRSAMEVTSASTAGSSASRRSAMASI
jgi:hypothetical protein